MPVGGYVDLQVNGYAGVDFNSDALTAAELHHACERLDADGVAAFLATIITDDIAAMCRRLATLARLREHDSLAQRLIAGLHIEGPFLNDAAGYRGAHPADAMRDADPGSMKQLLDAAAGLTRIVTLAPERDEGGRTTAMLAANGIVVSAGHTDASVDELRTAIDEGLSMFTHLGNGCPMQLHRHDNIVQRALSLAPHLWMRFIADGAHVPFVALGNYLRLAGRAAHRRHRRDCPGRARSRALYVRPLGRRRRRRHGAARSGSLALHRIGRDHAAERGESA